MFMKLYFKILNIAMTKIITQDLNNDLNNTLNKKKGQLLCLQTTSLDPTTPEAINEVTSGQQAVEPSVKGWKEVRSLRNTEFF